MRRFITIVILVCAQLHLTPAGAESCEQQQARWKIWPLFGKPYAFDYAEFAVAKEKFSGDLAGGRELNWLRDTPTSVEGKLALLEVIANQGSNDRVAMIEEILNASSQSRPAMQKAKRKLIAYAQSMFESSANPFEMRLRRGAEWRSLRNISGFLHRMNILARTADHPELSRFESALEVLKSPYTSLKGKYAKDIDSAIEERFMVELLTNNLETSLKKLALLPERVPMDSIVSAYRAHSNTLKNGLNLALTSALYSYAGVVAPFPPAIGALKSAKIRESTFEKVLREGYGAAEKEIYEDLGRPAKFDRVYRTAGRLYANYLAVEGAMLLIRFYPLLRNMVGMFMVTEDDCRLAENKMDTNDIRESNIANFRVSFIGFEGEPSVRAEELTQQIRVRLRSRDQIDILAAELGKGLDARDNAYLAEFASTYFFQYHEAMESQIRVYANNSGE